MTPIKIVVLLLLAALAGGCATASGGRYPTANVPNGFNWFPTLDIVVTNSCAGSLLYVGPPRGRQTVIQYGGQETIVLRRYPGESQQTLLVARGESVVDGASMGSQTRWFYYDQRGRRPESWEVLFLQGGVRRCGR
jgi:hypothetical protein